MLFRRGEKPGTLSALRTCEVDGDKAYFHKWTLAGYAIIEYLDGTAELVIPERIRFTDR